MLIGTKPSLLPHERKSNNLRGCQLLTLMIFRQAVSDVTNKSTKELHKKDAHEFLDGGPWLPFWCEVIDMDAEEITRRYKAGTPMRKTTYKGLASDGGQESDYKMKIAKINREDREWE